MCFKYIGNTFLICKNQSQGKNWDKMNKKYIFQYKIFYEILHINVIYKSNFISRFFEFVAKS